jgi:AraC-like DNA-binding protein
VYKFVILWFLGEVMEENITLINKEYTHINPISLGSEICEKSHHYGPAVRPYWLLHFVVSGKGIFQIKDREYELSAEEIFVIPPFVETYYEADEKDPWEYIWVGFTVNGNLPTKLSDTISCPQASYIFKSMLKAEQMTLGRTEYICAKIWELFSAIMEKKETKIDYIENALNIIHSEYMQDVTIQEIADRLNLDRTYFSHLFKAKMGMSPKKYLLNYRMELAADLIANHGQSISTTAVSVGYNDIYIFSKMFKQHFGVAPSQYKTKQDE